MLWIGLLTGKSIFDEIECKVTINANASSGTTAAVAASGEESRIKKLERLIKQGFDR